MGMGWDVPEDDAEAACEVTETDDCRTVHDDVSCLGPYLMVIGAEIPKIVWRRAQDDRRCTVEHVEPDQICTVRETGTVS